MITCCGGGSGGSGKSSGMALFLPAQNLNLL